MSYRGRGRGGFRNTSGPRQGDIDQFAAANSFPVSITGWTGATVEECVKFISRKCRISVLNATSDAAGVMHGYVKSQKDADDLANWSGVKFAGQSLRISKDFSGQGGTNTAIEAITQFLQSRYNPGMKMLNLASVSQDPNLVAKGFFGSVNTGSKFFPALMKVASDLKLDVETIDLSGNDLSDLSAISAMAPTFPKLRNLSLQNNNFKSLKVFDPWKHKLSFLREIILTQNPMIDNHTNPADRASINGELMRLFPRLIVLNGEIIRNEQTLMANLTFPFEAPEPMFFSDEEIRNMSTNFITNFYNLWDTNRNELLVLYQNESQFSMQVDSAHPHITEGGQGTDFGYYLPNSRNLARVSSTKIRQSRVAIGPANISKFFAQLPRSRHELIQKPHLYSMESFRFPQLNGIMMTLHGTFEETAAPDNTEQANSSASKNRFHYQKNKKTPLSPKSFDRTFIVIPGPNGSMIVASDLLLIRPPGGNEAWSATPSTPASATPTPTPTPTATPTPSGPTTADLPAEIKANLNPGQQELLVKVLLETKLNLQYGILLCEQSSWDYQQATVNFKNSVGSLPREAFQV
ncbi:hypothetical protein PGUG_03821 [Meyerozyma guilliermondii ATCC 6260]|uniref:mRNA export factor MEX67 n=1 Tax=Meyerozyma guilliermondii (strain ATCC 6260 / CBS 566 / DSM 6381 / JCM 1539 / NBRC 10279 / NRRL Y-324) TaxID=294746 RepID=A5DKM0_PICGU|nr:uncharacterized protein PGUG_03821 [Meyerozyma guilliermondii ATCC 6260]EDK39723.2 hypothetical protein PGUG_03821 [Meyerozyma guilliermondii ATCC 6260]